MCIWMCHNRVQSLCNLQSGEGQVISAQEDWVPEAQYTSKDF
jgi:hypothetical protein